MFTTNTGTEVIPSPHAFLPTPAIGLSRREEGGQTLLAGGNTLYICDHCKCKLTKLMLLSGQAPEACAARGRRAA